MSAVNPYQPPRADVADIVDESAEFEEPSFLTWRGRIGRLRYLAYFMGAYLVYGVLMAVSGAATAVDTGGIFGILVLLAGTLAFSVFVFMAAIQRAHDMDWSGWMVLLFFVPLVNFVVGLIFLFKGGTKHRNRFGAPPTPNTWGVRILACILPAIALVGIIAAVSLPAYKNYQDRARAAQMK